MFLPRRLFPRGFHESLRHDAWRERAAALVQTPRLYLLYATPTSANLHVAHLVLNASVRVLDPPGKADTSYFKFLGAFKPASIELIRAGAVFCTRGFRICSVQVVGSSKSEAGTGSCVDAAQYFDISG